MKYNSKEQETKFRATNLDLFLDYMGSICDLYINVIIDLPKKLNVQKLRRAMSLVAAKDPIISCRYIRENKLSYWVFKNSPHWDIEEIFSSDAIIEYASELITNPPHPEGNLPISIRLIHLNDRDRLHVRLSHILADGGGAKEFIYKLASAYRQILNNHSVNAEIGFWKDRSFFGIMKCLKNYPLGLLLSGLLLDKASLLLPENYFEIPMKLLTNTERKFVLLHLNSERVFQLKKFAKKRKAALNDILLAAFSRALCNCFETPIDVGKHFGVIVTSDMRKFIDCKRNLCNMSNWRIIEVGKLPLIGAGEILDNVARLTTRWKKYLLGLGNFLFNMIFLKSISGRAIRFLFSKLILSDTRAKVCRIGLTNFGLLNQRKLDFGDGPCIDAFMLPPTVTPPILLAGASGCAGKICLSIGYRTGSLSENKITMLTEEIDKELFLFERL